MNNKELIRRGKKLLGGNSDELFGTFSKIYPMTSENIKGTYELFDLKGKDILTVTSSGDHILCAALEGARRIDSFNINYLTEYYYHFKKAIIETYDFEKFKEIFLYNIIPIGVIKEKWYEEFRGHMDDKYLEFWDDIISYMLSNDIPFDGLFLACPNYFNLVNYLDEKSYNLLKSVLPSLETNFIHSDLMHLDKHLDSSYDYMFFSNVADYVGVFEVKDFTKHKLMEHLNPNGEIAYAYMYDSSKRIASRFEDNIYPISSAINDEKAKDYVLTLK